MRRLLRRGRGRLISLRPAKEAKALLVLLAAAVVARAVSTAAAFGSFAFGALDAAPEVGSDFGGAISSGRDEVDRGEVLQGLPPSPQVLDDCLKGKVSLLLEEVEVEKERRKDCDLSTQLSFLFPLFYYSRATP